MGERTGAADSDIPAAIEGFEDDEATMMWSREEIEAGGRLRAPGVPDLPELPDLDPPPPLTAHGPASAPARAPVAGGLDEDSLFGDVFPNEAPTSARPVRPTFDALGAPSIRVAPTTDELQAQSERPSIPSLVAPPRRSRRGLWIGVAMVAVVAGLVAAGVAFRQPLSAQLRALGIPAPF